MSESATHGPPDIHRQRRPTHQIEYIGTGVAVRPTVRLFSAEERKRLFEVGEDPLVTRFMEDVPEEPWGRDPKKLNEAFHVQDERILQPDEYGNLVKKPQDYIERVYVVTGNDPNNPKEFGRLQGYIPFYTPEDELRQAFIEESIKTLADPSKRQKGKHEYYEWLRQAIEREYEVFEMSRVNYQSVRKRRDRTSAPISNNNYSESLMTRATRVAAVEFLKDRMGLKDRYSKPKLVIIGWIDADNERSKLTAEATGRVPIGEPREFEYFDEKNHKIIKITKQLYVLNWDTLNKELHEIGLRAMEERIGRPMGNLIRNKRAPDSLSVK